MSLEDGEEWAIGLEDVFSISGRGIELSGVLLYGKPKPGHFVNVAMGGWYGYVEGLSTYLCGGGLWIGATVGVLISKQVYIDYRKRIKEDSFHLKHSAHRGYLLVGGPIPEDKIRIFEELRLPRYSNPNGETK